MHEANAVNTVHHAGDPLVQDVVRHTWPDQSAANATLWAMLARSLRMTRQEAELLAFLMSSANVSRYFEWGSGGSTELAAWRVLTSHDLEVHSADSSEAWSAQLAARSQVISQARDTGKLTFHAQSIGTVGAWGVPTNWTMRPASSRQRSSENYVDKPLSRAGGQFDLILIDGRFRVACALKALQHAHKETRVLIHDFSGKRLMTYHYYTLISHHWYTKVTAAGTLVVLKPRPEALLALRGGTDTKLAARRHQYDTELALRRMEMWR